MFYKAFEFLKRERKIVFTFAIILVLFFVMSPGVFFRLPPQKNEPDGVKASKTSAIIHAIICAMILTLFIYYFFGTTKVVQPMVSQF